MAREDTREGPRMRVGIGYDVHAFASDEERRPLVLGGITIPGANGLAGHSDADVLLHAIVDALLGAAALGDIGTYFPSNDPRWHNAASMAFLAHARARIEEEGWSIGNIDATIVAERPRLLPHIMPMRQHIAAALDLPMDRVSIKSKTTDGLGFTGRAEGMACHVVVLLDR